MTELLNDILTPFTTSIVCCIIAILGVVVINTLKTIAKKLNLDIGTTIFAQIQTMVETIVVATNQKFVDEMKAENPDGKLTDEQKEKIFKMVKDLVVAGLSTEEMEYIKTKFGDLSSGLEQMIESAVAYNHSSVFISEEYEDDGEEE